jgi:hypothetical protein
MGMFGLPVPPAPPAGWAVPPAPPAGCAVPPTPPLALTVPPAPPVGLTAPPFPPVGAIDPPTPPGVPPTPPGFPPAPPAAVDVPPSPPAPPEDDLLEPQPAAATKETARMRLRSNRGGWDLRWCAIRKCSLLVRRSWRGRRHKGREGNVGLTPQVRHWPKDYFRDEVRLRRRPRAEHDAVTGLRCGLPRRSGTAAS